MRPTGALSARDYALSGELEDLTITVRRGTTSAIDWCRWRPLATRASGEIGRAIPSRKIFGGCAHAARPSDGHASRIECNTQVALPGEQLLTEAEIVVLNVPEEKIPGRERRRRATSLTRPLNGMVRPSSDAKFL